MASLEEDGGRCKSPVSTGLGNTAQGAWFPTGYYGHFRCRTRDDLDYQANFRREAAPHPPTALNKRLESLSYGSHPFSIHDNKHTFCNDGLYFGQGLGKRRVPGRSGQFKPDLIAWNTTTSRHLHRRAQSAAASSVHDHVSRTDVASPPSTSGTNARGHRLMHTAPARLYRPPNTTDFQPMTTSYQRTHRLSPGDLRQFSARRTISRPSSSASTHLPRLEQSSVPTPPPSQASMTA